jgi:cytochrome c oxidase subunit 2
MKEMLGNTMIHTLPHLLAFFDSSLLPPSGSTSSARYDPIWNLVLLITTFFFLLVVGMMCIFLVKFRRQAHIPANHEAATHNTPLEVAWTVIPLIIVLALFVVGLKGYMWYDQPPSNSYTIVAKLSQWKFVFYYPNGGVSPNLYVPISSDGKPRPIRLQIEAEPGDVLHALYIPAYRIQRGAVPGRITDLWFDATNVPPVHPGMADTPENHFYDIFCTQYCGDGHSTMRSRVYVIADEAEFQKKLTQLANPFIDADGKILPLESVGKNLVDIYGCKSCHTMDGKPGGTGPTWLNLYKSDVKFSKTLEPGFTLSATDSDEKWHEYLQRSIITPSADIVSPFPDAMTNFGPQLSGADPNDMKDDKNRRREAIIWYIKSLDQNGEGGKPKYYTPAPIPTSAPGAAPATAPESATTPAGKT